MAASARGIGRAREAFRKAVRGRDPGRDHRARGGPASVFVGRGTLVRRDPYARPGVVEIVRRDPHHVRFEESALSLYAARPPGDGLLRGHRLGSSAPRRTLRGRGRCCSLRVRARGHRCLGGAAGHRPVGVLVPPRLVQPERPWVLGHSVLGPPLERAAPPGARRWSAAPVGAVCGNGRSRRLHAHDHGVRDGRPGLVYLSAVWTRRGRPWPARWDGMLLGFPLAGLPHPPVLRDRPSSGNDGVANESSVVTEWRNPPGR